MGCLMAQQEQPETGGTGLGHRSVSLTRLEHGSYLATNERGGTLRFGGGGESRFFHVAILARNKKRP